VVMEFWEKSETEFYRILDQLAELPGEQRQAPPEIYAVWSKQLWILAFSLFDAWALEAPGEDLDMKRIITAREGLKKKINTNKSMKQLRAKAKFEKEVA